MKKYLIHIGCFLILSVTGLRAQTVILQAPVIELDENAQFVDVEIKVDSFINVSGLQFSLRWNTDVLEFDEIRDMNLVGLQLNDNFGLDSVSEGYLTFYWFDPAADGETHPNGYTIFSFRANVVGSLHSGTGIEFSSNPTPIEISDPDYNVFNYRLNNGFISVGEFSSADDITIIKDVLVSPNPFKEQTNIQFYLDEASEVTASLYNVDGKLIFEKNYDFGSGSQSITLIKDNFSTAGVYFLNLNTEKSKITQKLYFVQ